MSLGALLKHHRMTAGFTQEELAEKAEVSARTVSDVERGLRSRIYRDTASRLADALGVEAEAREEFEAAARGPRSTPSSNLPLPPTRLIGRARELSVILSALERPEVRLLTLTGPGGIGKTRIALEAAAHVRATTPVFLVELGNTFDPAQVISMTARAIGVSGAKEPTVDSIAEHLGDAPVLIVLDTFEHVLDSASDVAVLLAACPRMTVLATSREALRIRGEHEVAIPTLDLPAEPTMEAVVGSPASALFIERAQAVRPSLTIDARSAELIAEVCRRVNGLPLAIELAAARAKHLSLQQLSDQLEHRLNVLTGGPRDLPRRQQTMRDTVRWSYDLLESNEQQVFRELCVFSGGWTLEAASAVCTADALDVVSALVDKSLVIRTEAEEPRFGMLDVVREFGSELRSSDGTEERHLAYFVTRAERIEPELGRSSQRTWIQRLGYDHDNIRAALRYAIGKGEAEPALRLAGAIWRFWLLQGHLSEGRSWLGEALSLDAAPRWRVKGLWGSAWLAYHQGDYEVAEQCSVEMLPLAESSGDPVELRNTLTIRGIVDLSYARFADAVDAFERCIDLLRESGADWLKATSLLNLGTALTHAHDPRARAILQEARAAYETLGDEHYAARAVLYEGYAELLAGDEESADSSFRKALITFWELDDLWGTTEVLEGFAALAGARGLPERTATIAGAADALRQTINAQPFRADRAILERNMATVRKAIDETTWRATWEKGRELTAEDAVEFALEGS